MELIVIGSGTGCPPGAGGAVPGAQGCRPAPGPGLGRGSLRSMLASASFLGHRRSGPDPSPSRPRGDLIPFLFATRYSLGYTRQEPFRLLAARGLPGFTTGSWKPLGMGGAAPGPHGPQGIAPDGPDEVQEAGLLIRSAPTNHTEGSLPTGWRPKAGPWFIPGIRI